MAETIVLNLRSFVPALESMELLAQLCLYQAQCSPAQAKGFTKAANLLEVTRLAALQKIGSGNVESSRRMVGLLGETLEVQTWKVRRQGRDQLFTGGPLELTVDPDNLLQQLAALIQPFDISAFALTDLLEVVSELKRLLGRDSAKSLVTQPATFAASSIVAERFLACVMWFIEADLGHEHHDEIERGIHGLNNALAAFGIAIERRKEDQE